MILKPKPCSFPLQSYGCYKNHFCINVNRDVILITLYIQRGESRIFRRGGGLTTARGSGVCPLPRKAEKFLPLLFVTKN